MDGPENPAPFPWLHGSDEPAEVWLDGIMEPAWVIEAYRRGFFPWPVDERLAWWCPHERLVFDPPAPRLSRSALRSMRRQGWRVTLDQATPQVIAACRDARGPGRDGTWITPDIAATYAHLAGQGLVHSCEVWEGETLVGGVYGLSLGRAFFGESMFHDRTDASKVAVGVLAAWLDHQGFDLFDGQVENEHLISLGGSLVSRDAYLARLERSLEAPTVLGPWGLELEPADLVRRFRAR